MKSIDEKTLYALRICDDLLAREKPEHTISERQMEKLQREVRGLFDAIRAAQLDDNVKQYMFRHLELIDRALQEWRFRGAEPLHQAVEGVVGSLVLHQEMYAKTNRAAAGKRFWQFLGRVAVVASVVGTSIQIGKEIKLCLPGPEEPAVVGEASSSNSEDREEKP
jgi:hypothetical protein